MLSHLVCEKPPDLPSDLSAAIEECRRIDASLYVLAFGKRNLDSLESWCPDCTKAMPIILSALENHKAVLLELTVHRESYKGRSERRYEYSTGKHIELKAIPQLYHWDLAENHPTGSLVENECFDADKVQDFIADTCKL